MKAYMKLPILTDEQILAMTSQIESSSNKYISTLCCDSFLNQKIKELRYLEAWLITQGVLRCYGHKEFMKPSELKMLEEFSLLLFAKYSEPMQCSH